jgi:integrase
MVGNSCASELFGLLLRHLSIKTLRHIIPKTTQLILVPPAPEGREGEPVALTPAQRLLRKLVLDSVASPHSKRNYARALDDLFAFCASRPLSRSLLTEWRASMESLSLSTINVRLSEMRKLVSEARNNGMLGAEEAASLTDISNISQRGTRLGNWLTREQAKELLAVPDRATLKGKRDYVILALLVGCALRRNELAELDVATIQQREGRWVLADLEGKGRRIRTVAIPIWVKQGINAWMTAAAIEDGRLLRSVSKSGTINRETLSDWAVWSVVEQSSKQIGIERFGAHDLRRTCAKLCRKNGGDLEQIKFLLGHSSIQTTERYLDRSRISRSR